MRFAYGLMIGLGLGGGFTACSGDTSSGSGGTSSGSDGGSGGTSSTTTSTETSSSGGTGGGGQATSTSGGTGEGRVPGTEGFDCAPAQGDVPTLKLTEVANGFTQPLFVTFAPGDESRLFVVEQPGTIQVMVDGVVQDEPFLDITDNVQNGGNEQGLLGLAFHPDYAENGRFYVNYSAQGGVNGASNGGTIVSEFTVSDDPNLADASTERVLLTQSQPYGNHNGGMVTFGPDGFLYIGFGDGGNGGDPQCNAPNLDTWLGKLLRIDVDGNDAGEYGVPSGNLPGGAPEVWDYGLRNPWRFTFDGCTGDLYIGDVGQETYEELNIVPSGQGHDNFGWSFREGLHAYPYACDFDPELEGAVEPVFEYDHGTGASITGGYVYRGSAIPALRGTYFFADYSSGAAWALEYVDGEVQNQRSLTRELGTSSGEITSFGQDARGEVYLVRRGGAIQRIDAAD